MSKFRKITTGIAAAVLTVALGTALVNQAPTVAQEQEIAGRFRN